MKEKLTADPNQHNTS